MSKLRRDRTGPPRRAAGLLLLLTVLLVASVFFRFRTHRTAAHRNSSTLPGHALDMLIQFEQQEAQKYWASELIAENYGRLIEQVWDRINHSTNRWQDIAAVPFDRITLPPYEQPAVLLPHGIKIFQPGTAPRSLNNSAWREMLTHASETGWQVDQCEFRHIAFTNATTSHTASSTFYFSAHLANPLKEERAILEGDILVTWTGEARDPKILDIDASHVQLRTRAGPLPFRPILSEEVSPPEGSYFIDPLIVWDLDHDGSNEIILAARNRVYRRKPNGSWTPTALCDHDPGLIFTAVLGDFDGNGTTDFLCAKFEGLFLYEGTEAGRFPNPPRQVWIAQPHLRYAQTIALGDIDGDGDLDIFLGQYKVPYEKGQMPHPYYDASDGHASYLLANDGHGNFTDISQKAGLGPKRGRRVYNASLIDLDRDGHLDLILVSDFAGLDAFRNDGFGNFKDVTTAWFPQPEAFGMASCFADFNRDGRLDLLMIGMNSPTADRLSSQKLNRPYDLPDVGLRSRATYGNRLLFGQPDGAFQQTLMSKAVARSGWSWGCAAEDLDNDGFPDLYIANGHETRASVRDYESEFWLHDIYVGNSTENTLAHAYFREKMPRTRGAGWSYGGYEKNRLFLNLSGTNFVECAYLLGLALQADSRNVIASDLDNDGRVDLILTTFEIYPKTRQTLQIFRNELPVETPFQSFRVKEIQNYGRIFSSGKTLEPVLSSGSYRSQSEPALRLKPDQAGELARFAAGARK